MSFLPTDSLGDFIPQYQNFVVTQQNTANVLNAMYTNIAFSLNRKVNGIHEVVEVLTGSTYPDLNNAQKKRYSYRKIFNIGTIGVGATATIPHGITSPVFLKMIGGAQITGGTQRPLPFSSTVAVNQNIEMYADNTNLYIVNGAGNPQIDTGIVILEYLKG